MAKRVGIQQNLFVLRSSIEMAMAILKIFEYKSTMTPKVVII